MTERRHPPTDDLDSFWVRGLRNGSVVSLTWHHGSLTGDPPTVDLVEVEAELLVIGATDALARRSGLAVEPPATGTLLDDGQAAFAVIRRVLDRVLDVDPPWLANVRPAGF